MNNINQSLVDFSKLLADKGLKIDCTTGTGLKQTKNVYDKDITYKTLYKNADKAIGEVNSQYINYLNELINTNSINIEELLEYQKNTCEGINSGRPLQVILILERFILLNKIKMLEEKCEYKTYSINILKNDINNTNCLVVLTNTNSKLPIKSSSESAGFDLFSCENIIVSPGDESRKLINVGIKIQFNKEYYARIAPRSGLSVKSFIDIGAGVIDSDYRGEVKVLIINHGSKDFKINIGDRIAQLIFEKYENNIQLIKIDNLDETNRGENGFGSSGK